MNKHWQPQTMICLGIATLIFIGTFLLMLSGATTGGRQNLIDALFTSASAVNVTGLIVVNTEKFYTTFGKIVIMFLIQFGGLGAITIGVFPLLVLGKEISFATKFHLSNERGWSSFGNDLINFVKSVFKVTFTIELLGMAIYAISFVPRYGLLNGLWYSMFHAVSAFCNAGFSTFGNNLGSYCNDPIVVWTTTMLIAAGGIGFPILYQIFNREKLNEHSKLALNITLLLNILGAVFILWQEWNNPGMVGLGMWSKISNAFFWAVTPKTAGFNTVSTSGLTIPTIFLLMFYMYIGASPGGTGGGVKTTTFGVVAMWAWQKACRGKQQVVYDKRNIPTSTLIGAMGILFLYTTIIISAIFLLLLVEQAVGFIDIVFEVLSAIGTVGLSRGLTDCSLAVHFSNTGKLILVFLMYIGRVGPATLGFSLFKKMRDETTFIKKIDGNIAIG